MHPAFLATASGLCALAGAALIARGVPANVSPTPFYTPLAITPAAWPVLPPPFALDTRDLHVSSLVVDARRGTPAPAFVVFTSTDYYGQLVENRVPVSGASASPGAPGRVLWTLSTPHQLTPGVAASAVLVRVGGVVGGASVSSALPGVFP